MVSPKNSNFPSGASPTDATPTTATTTPVMPISLLPTAVAGQATQAIAPASRRRSVRFADEQLESDPSRATTSTSSGETGEQTLHAQHPVCEKIPSKVPMPAGLDSKVSSRAQVPPPIVAFQLRSEPPGQPLLAEGHAPGAADLTEGIGRMLSPTELPRPALSAAATTAPESVGPTLLSSHFGGSANSRRLGSTGSTAENFNLHGAQREHGAPERQNIGSPGMQEAPSPGLLNGNDGGHRQVNEPSYEESAAGDVPAELRPLHPAPGIVDAKATMALPQANKLRTTTLEPCDGATFARGSRVRCESSRAIVPYMGGGDPEQLPKRQLYNFIYEDHPGNNTGLDPVVSRLSALPPPSLGSEAGPNCPPSALNLTTDRSASDCSGSHPETSPAAETANMPQNPDQRPDWVVVSVAQAEQAARKLRDQVNKTKELEVTVKKHKRERVLLYDAAMKQAAKWEEEGISEAKQIFEREEGVMRETVDKELQKINDLYQERCRDYAQMVSDECEGEVSKSSADLRKDWARQKKTIDQLVRGGGEEDRRVEVIARAVTEQLQEERKDEIAVIRAEICSDVKLEFESREEALRDALESQFQADLDGQLLLAEIRHQKEIDQLRAELSVRETPSAEAASGTMVVYSGDASQKEKKGEGSSHVPSPGSPSPSLSRRPLQPNTRVGLAAKGKGVATSLREAATATKKPRLGTKLPAFKPPSQKNSSGDDGETAKTAKMPSKRSGNTATPKSKVQVKPKPKVQAKLKVQAKKSRTASLGRRAKNTEKITIAQDTPNDSETSARDKEDEDLDEGITSALTVSPVKATSGDIFTPSTENDNDSSVQPLRPKKRAKRLFSASP